MSAVRLPFVLQLTTSTRRSTLPGDLLFFGTSTSTHDLHTEVDLFSHLRHSLPAYFNSRPPHGGRQRVVRYSGIMDRTSTHDLHTEVDVQHNPHSDRLTYFNSRPPHGGRLCSTVSLASSLYFNSRPPHGGRQRF